MVIGLLKDAELEGFARELAADIHGSFPPSRFPAEGKAVATLDRTVQRFGNKVRDYQKKHKLGMLKRLKLSNAFQKELDALGYGNDFVREVTLRMAMVLSGRE